MAESITGKPHPHYQFLDGLRGLAALCVVFDHAVRIGKGQLKGGWIYLDSIASKLGTDAVVLFILLSGFCLMLPVAKTASLELRGGFRQYLMRRARRILPSYYAALALAFLLPVLIDPLRFNTPVQLSLRTWCHFDGPTDLLAHVLLIFNLFPRFAQNIIVPLWSIGTEWQIYIVFGLLLLPIMRRWGVLATLVSAALIGILAFRGMPQERIACPWMLVIFALGMAAAMLTRDQLNTKSMASKIIAFCTVVLVAPAFLFPVGWSLWVKNDILVGMLGTGLILTAYRQAGTSKRFSVRGLLEWRPLVWIGISSYSLYLTHYLILLVVYFLLQPLNLSPVQFILSVILIGCPLSIFASRCFFQCWEKPFCLSYCK